MRDRFHECQSVGLTSSKEFTRMIMSMNVVLKEINLLLMFQP